MKLSETKSLHNVINFKNNLFDEHEQLLNRLCTYTLGIPKKSRNIAAKAD